MSYVQVHENRLQSLPDMEFKMVANLKYKFLRWYFNGFFFIYWSPPTKNKWKKIKSEQRNQKGKSAYWVCMTVYICVFTYENMRMPLKTMVFKYIILFLFTIRHYYLLLYTLHLIDTRFWLDISVCLKSVIFIYRMKFLSL